MNITTHYQRVLSVLLAGLLSFVMIYPLQANNHSLANERPLKEVLEEFSETYEVLFSYDSRSIDAVLVDFQIQKGELLEPAIDRLLKPTNFAYESFGEKYYVIYERSKKGNKSAKKLGKYIRKIEKLEQEGDLSVQSKKRSNKAILRSIVTDTHKLQLEKTISGTITSEAGEPLTGATISAKGTTQGTLTDERGKFQITVTDEVSTLVISYIGYERQEVEIGGRTVIDLVMVESASSLDEVVVIGYGSAKKSDLTGSIESLGSKSFDAQPIVRMDQALQGRTAGVQITQTSGFPGAGYKIRIRGPNSISGSNNPLYVIDGLVVGDINSINVNDIASMEVLKDASATAIYGSRGANGVVLISTKTGKAGKGQITFETFHGVSTVFQELPILDAVQYAEGVNYLEGTELFTQQEISGLAANPPQSMQDAIFRSANSHNYQLSFSGGSDKTDYYISANVYNAEGTVISRDYNRYTVRANINTRVQDKIKVGFNATGSRVETLGESVGLASAYRWDRTTPPFDANGEYNLTPVLHPGVGQGGINPIVAALENIRDDFTNRIVAMSYAEVELINNLVLNVSGGVEWSYRNNSRYVPLLTSNGISTIATNNNTRLQNTNRLTYTWDSNPNHRLQLDAIHEQQQFTAVSLDANGNGYFSDATTYRNISLAEIQRINNFNSNENLQSFLGRVNYSYKYKYLITASLRADGSSKFREENRWGYFPSGSVAWRISEEAFMQDVAQIDNLKLRVSYGITGSQAIGALATRAQPVINPGLNYPFSGGAATIATAPSRRLANPNLTWEQTAQTNIGLDIGLWNSKLTASIDLYQKTTSDLLLDRILPEFVGPTVVAENVGKVENKGIEVSLGLDILRNSDWNVFTNFTFNRNINTVLELVDDKPIEKGNTYLGQFLGFNPTRLEVGESMGMFRGYIFEGVYQAGEEAAAAEFGKAPGDAKYADISGPDGVPDGNITTDDLSLIGNGYPDFIFGWYGGAAYKNLDLSFQFIGSVGNDIYNLQRGRMMSLGSATFHASHLDYLDRWTPTNPSNIPAARDGVEILSTQFIEDGSYFTLKNVTLSYTLQNAIQAIGLDAFKVYVNLENAFILTNYRGFDPESTSSGNLDVDVGIDHGAYPLSRTITGGVKLTF
ncbi:MAG: TonB-dependent receptor [Bacteroidota bacterium]